MELTPVGQGITLLGTLGGIWVVFRIIRWFQRDFLVEARRELVDARAAALAAEEAADRERNLRILYQIRVAILEASIGATGVPVPPWTDRPGDHSDAE